jgi:Tfp pilus assembly protein PilF
MPMTRLSVLRLALAAPLLVLAGCATVPVTAELGLFDDARFGAPSVRTDRAQLFELSPAMRRFLQQQLTGSIRLHGPRRGLFMALNEGGHLHLDYDASLTRTAAQAFEARAGNCLSLVVMTAAFARELELRVDYHSVHIEEVWSRSRNFVMLSGHVNLSLSHGIRDINQGVSRVGALIIDFIPIDDETRQRAVGLSEDTIVAMFMNNRAVELMEQGDLNSAYAMLRTALKADPSYLNAVNTLGVLYRRHGDRDLAERSLRWVLTQEPRNLQALSNLIVVLREQARLTEALAVEVTLQSLQPRTPFADFERGLAAAKAGDWVAARRAFERELKQVAQFHELHYWLGRTYYELGERELAAIHMQEARDQAQTLDQRSRYAYKLEVLRQPPARPTATPSLPASNPP